MKSESTVLSGFAVSNVGQWIYACALATYELWHIFLYHDISLQSNSFLSFPPAKQKLTLNYLLHIEQADFAC